MFQLVIEDKEDSSHHLLGGGLSNEGEEPAYKVGDLIALRPQDDSPSSSSFPSTGTVRYVGEGPTPGSGRLYLGVEWDDPSRGRHNGTLEGVTFFKPQKHPEDSTCCSFIRPSRKVLRLRSFLEAVEERYSCQDDDKISALKIITLDPFPGIHTLTSSSAPTTISFPSLTTLTLTSTLLTCPFNDLLSLLLQNSPKLAILNLSRNKFLKFSQENDSLDLELLSLKTVALAESGLTWANILSLSRHWPNVEELAVPFNKIGKLSAEGDWHSLQKLRRLDLEGCSLGTESTWPEIIEGLSKLKSLSSLNLSSNQIQGIPSRPSTDPSLLLLLTEVNLTSNAIPSFSSITALSSWFPALETLRLAKNPLHQLHDPRTSTQLVIALLPSLKKLEGVVILRQERRDAELDYCKSLLESWKREEKREELQRENPRFQDLAKDFGLLEDLEAEKVDGKGKKVGGVAGTMLELKIVLASPSSPAPPSFFTQKRVLRTMNVQKLRALIQRTFRLPFGKPLKLTAKSVRNPDISFILENDLMEIGQYSLEDGDQIVVESCS